MSNSVQTLKNFGEKSKIGIDNGDTIVYTDIVG